MKKSPDKPLESCSFWIGLPASTVKMFLALIVSGLIGVFAMYSTGLAPYAPGARGVSDFYFAAPVIVLSVAFLRGWGVLATLLGALIHGLALNLSPELLLSRSLADVIEAFLPYLFFKHTDALKLLVAIRPSVNRKAFLYPALFALASSPLAMGVLNFAGHAGLSVNLGFALLIVFLVLFVGTLANALFLSLRYLLFVVITPSALAAVYACWLQGMFSHLSYGQALHTVLVWTSTNTVLLGGFLTPVFCFARSFFGRGSDKSRAGLIRLDTETHVRLETVVYYFGLLIWIYLFAVASLSSMFNKTWCALHLIPWFVGVAFLTANMFSSLMEEAKTGNTESVFDQLENRVVVLEKNTEYLLLMLTFLFPMLTIILDERRMPILLTLTLAATCATSVVIIIWIPRSATQTIRVLKAIKTTLHVYAVSLILLSVVMFLKGMAK